MSNKAVDNVVIRNIYYMMAYAFRALDLKEYERLKTEDFEEVDDLLAAILAIGMAAQQRRGYERGYLPEEEDLAGVRGRIDMRQTARNEMARRQKAHCIYDEFTEDTQKNRILKATARILATNANVDPVRRRDLKRCLVYMGGPWSRAQAVADAFERAGHHAVLGTANDGNCTDLHVASTCQLPVPSPLGLPMAVSSRTFPLAEKLGIAGRKPVRSFEEVLWLTGTLAYEYECASVEAICDAVVSQGIDAVYSEYSLPAIIAARALGIPVFGSFSYTTQASFASASEKAGGVRRLLGELGLPAVESSLDLFGWLDRRFVPSCRELEPIEDVGVEHVGFLRGAPHVTEGERDCAVVYLGAGSVPRSRIERMGVALSDNLGCDIYVAGYERERHEGFVHYAPRFDFSQLLPRARCLVHHGGQNSTMDALSYGIPQVIVPGRVFERIYNAESVERAGAGMKLERFNANELGFACRRVVGDPSFAEKAAKLRSSLSSCGGAARIVSVVEEVLE